STTRGPSKRQRKDSKPRTHARCGGGGATAADETSTHISARHHGRKRPCQELGCTIRPSHNEIGSKKAEFCVKHAKPAMINLVRKRCGHPGCVKYPSCGTDGSKKAEFCVKHAK
ncbi:unnamed protein product, partial [Ectocarpus fasciculatus]